MASRFDLRKDENGWTVFDVFSGWPAVVHGVAQTGLDIQDAADLSELLDLIAQQGRPPEIDPNA
ncbi:hypothetical protein ASD89_01075 [Caulobacter sp. Root656]|nr:hypothetical protein ASD89_01075 [Caulobacter sp. Root656]